MVLSISLHIPQASGAGTVVKTLFVDLNGGGDFRCIQGAINSIPDNNKFWTRIHVAAGVYREKVMIPQSKEYILLEGEGSEHTSIEWGDYANDPKNDTTATSATFSSLADNFVAKYIAFKNTYNGGTKTAQALAALVSGDKSSFYNCSFTGIQDTLSDAFGRHYYLGCHIEGAFDFIFGNGQTIFQECTIWTVSCPTSPGYVTAQGRSTALANGGFVFKSCKLDGVTKTYLGRAWRGYARVIFYETYMSDIVVPLGWDAWLNKGHENLITFAESGCTGEGSNTAGRVPWEKTLTAAELKYFTDITYIDNEGWLAAQPI
ncbi:probable pectinesterase 29 [Typha angustifolia]|uniref:probable pectinesterase 29 n=1 Tax=Typha angustifolia TaxID=59011 RepID=UPI003C2F6345